MKGKSTFTIGFDTDFSDPEVITKVEEALRTTMRNSSDHDAQRVKTSCIQGEELLGELIEELGPLPGHSGK